MGQYYVIVNLDKREYLYPHRCGDGLKLLEFGSSAGGTMTALAVLLADGNGRGGGDLHSTNRIIGSWSGDRIVIAGDYADPGRFTGDPSETSTDLAESEFEEVSRKVLRAMADDCYLARAMKEARRWDENQSVFEYAMGEEEAKTR